MNEHGEVGQELCEFILFSRHGQVVKERVDDDSFVRQIWKRQRQQLCALLCSQECQDFNLKGNTKQVRVISISSQLCLFVFFLKSRQLTEVPSHRVELWVEMDQLSERQKC